MNNKNKQQIKKLNKRQEIIFDFIRTKNETSNQEILAEVKKQIGEVHRNTIINDLDLLLGLGLLTRIGKAGADVRYKENIPNEGHRFFDVDTYFSITSDNRQLKSTKFNNAVFEILNDMFNSYELTMMMELNNEHTEKSKQYSETEIRREIERFTIELSWKSSRIEGNTYSLIDTEVLIKNNREAKGHTREEAIEILNHKKAVDYAMETKSDFKKIDLQKIDNLHSILVDGLRVDKGLRKHAVRITGTKYEPMEFEPDIRSAMNKLIKLINRTTEPLSKALIAVIMISYIQPFADGNKRTARILGNAILLAHNIAPLSYRSIDEADYKKGMILFYEQNSFRFFKELFMAQFKFSINNYFFGPKTFDK